MERRSHALFPVHVDHKISAFGVHEDGMLMVTAFFDRREHLGENAYIKKCPLMTRSP